MAAATMAATPAAGPLTLNCEPLRNPITIPPIMPEINPLNKGAFDASATPRQSGNATRKTTIDAGISAPRFFMEKVERLIFNKFLVSKMYHQEFHMQSKYMHTGIPFRNRSNKIKLIINEAILREGEKSV